jgi:hypothetical protein
MTTALAFQADVRAEAHDRPLIRAAGMGFPQAQVIVQLQVGKHGKDYTAAANRLAQVRSVYENPH